MGWVLENEIAAVLLVHLLDRLAHLALEALHPRPHPLQLLLEAEHGLDAGQVEAELRRQPLDQAQALEVGLRVEAGVPGGALRADQPFLLVHAQRLRVHADELGGDGDHVARAIIHPAIPSPSPRAATTTAARRARP